MSDDETLETDASCFNPFRRNQHKKTARRNLRKVRAKHLDKLNIPITESSLNLWICDSCRIKIVKRPQAALDLLLAESKGESYYPTPSRSSNSSTTSLENIVTNAGTSDNSPIPTFGNDIGVLLVPVRREKIIILNNTVVPLKEPTPIKRTSDIEGQSWLLGNCSKIKKTSDENVVRNKMENENEEIRALCNSMRLPYNFRGYIAPVITPFHNDSTRSLNLTVIPQYAEFLADRGINGILVNGTMGEGPAMNVEERKTVAETWARAVKSTKQHLMIQIGGAPLPDVLELAKHAENIGVDSLLCLPEIYFKPTTSKQLVEYLRLVGQAAPRTPLLYYHIPMLSNVNINMPEFLGSVGDRIPSFVGIKFTSTNLDEGTKAYYLNNKEFAVFLGCDQIMAGAFALGMDSAIASSFNMLPELGNEILKASTAGDLGKAREIQQRLTKVVDTIVAHGAHGWTQSMKVAMGLLTPFDLGPVRAPLTPISNESVTAMKNELRALGLQVLR